MEIIDTFENKMEIHKIPIRPNESSIFTTEKENEAKDPSKFTDKAQKDPVEKQSDRKGQTVNNPNFIETISQVKSEEVPRTIRTYKKGNKSSIQSGYSDNHEIYHSSSKENDGINGI